MPKIKYTVMKETSHIAKIFKQVYGAEMGLYYDQWRDVATGVVDSSDSHIVKSRNDTLSCLSSCAVVRNHLISVTTSQHCQHVVGNICQQRLC